MSLRATRHKRADGSLVTPLQLAERGWNSPKQRSEVRVLYHCGRAEAPRTAERLRKLAGRILKRCAPEEMVAQAPPWRLRDTWPYGVLDVLEAIWTRLGLPEVIAEHLAHRSVACALARALFAMVAHRACAPRSKLSCDEQWWRDDGRIAGTAPLAFQHLYRAMDVLEAHQDEIKQALYVRRADLLHLDVELLFSDTTSLPFDLDEADQGHGDDDLVAGRRAAGAKTSGAPCKRGLANNGRADAPQIVLGLAVTRDGLPGRHGVCPGQTVDVTTGAHVKEDLRGWNLSRWVLVGDAGMVSPENLDRRSKSGGKSIGWYAEASRR
jgi:hypothetical protein